MVLRAVPGRTRVSRIYRSEPEALSGRFQVHVASSRMAVTASVRLLARAGKLVRGPSLRRSRAYLVTATRRLTDCASRYTTCRRYAARFRTISGGAMHEMRCIRSAESSAEAIRNLRQVTRAFVIDAGASHGAVSEIEAAVGEALANVHVHAYRGESGPVELFLEVDGAEFTCLVRDEGRARTDVAVPRTVPGGRDSWGLYLMSQLMDRVEISHPQGREHGTVVRMRKSL